jgi:hypothetical protein
MRPLIGMLRAGAKTKLLFIMSQIDGQGSTTIRERDYSPPALAMSCRIWELGRYDPTIMSENFVREREIMKNPPEGA